jgi:hypothetical protein
VEKVAKQCGSTSVTLINIYPIFENSSNLVTLILAKKAASVKEKQFEILLRLKFLATEK